jgi:hypothetical protein
MLIPLARAAGSQRNTCLPYEIYGLGILRSIGLGILGSIGLVFWDLLVWHSEIYRSCYSGIYWFWRYEIYQF